MNRPFTRHVFLGSGRELKIEYGDSNNFVGLLSVAPEARINQRLNATETCELIVHLWDALGRSAPFIGFVPADLLRDVRARLPQEKP